MRRSERLAQCREVLSETASDEHGFAVFEDANSPGRVVQVAMGDPGEQMVEATNHYTEEPPDPSPKVLERLTALGFTFTDDDQYPWRPVDMSLLEPVAELIDDAFEALGADPDFDLHLYATQEHGEGYRGEPGSPPDMSWVGGVGGL